METELLTLPEYRERNHTASIRQDSHEPMSTITMEFELYPLAMIAGEVDGMFDELGSRLIEAWGDDLDTAAEHARQIWHLIDRRAEAGTLPPALDSLDICEATKCCAVVHCMAHIQNRRYSYRVRVSPYVLNSAALGEHFGVSREYAVLLQLYMLRFWYDPECACACVVTDVLDERTEFTTFMVRSPVMRAWCEKLTGIIMQALDVSALLVERMRYIKRILKNKSRRERDAMGDPVRQLIAGCSKAYANEFRFRNVHPLATRALNGLTPSQRQLISATGDKLVLLSRAGTIADDTNLRMMNASITLPSFGEFNHE